MQSLHSFGGREADRRGQDEYKQTKETIPVLEKEGETQMG